MMALAKSGTKHIFHTSAQSAMEVNHKIRFCIFILYSLQKCSIEGFTEQDRIKPDRVVIWRLNL